MAQLSSSGAPSVSPHCSSNASVSQTNGCSCGPENTGPSTGWFTSESEPRGVPSALASSSSLAPDNPSTSPTSTPGDDGRKAAVTSFPPSVTRKPDRSASGAAAMLTRAFPPVTMSGRPDRICSSYAPSPASSPRTMQAPTPSATPAAMTTASITRVPPQQSIPGKKERPMAKRP